MRHMFISVGLTNDVNIKWVGGLLRNVGSDDREALRKYIRDDADEQLARLVGARTETLGETVEEKTGRRETQAVERIRDKVGGPTWTRTRAGRKPDPATKPER